MKWKGLSEYAYGIIIGLIVALAALVISLNVYFWWVLDGGGR